MEGEKVGRGKRWGEDVTIITLLVVIIMWWGHGYMAHLRLS